MLRTLQIAMQGDSGPEGLRPRQYVIEEYTQTVCPHCFGERQRPSTEADVIKDKMLVSHDGSIRMRRFCREHGETESLYEEDAGVWRARSGWSTPTLRVTPDRAGNLDSFPAAYRDGLPASHGKHTCILLLNLTSRITLREPAASADAETHAIIQRNTSGVSLQNNTVMPPGGPLPEPRKQ
jgi:uncharacterized radical SAM superfamily Fe-S cluster-containing enzyme